MINVLDPVVGQWYVRHDSGAMFRVVAVDPRGGAIEMQNFDGDLEEIDLDVWRGINLEAVEAPEDWTGPYDDLEPDDLGYTERAPSQQNWRLSLESLPGVEDQWNYTRTPEEFREELAGPFEMDFEEK